VTLLPKSVSSYYRYEIKHFMSMNLRISNVHVLLHIMLCENIDNKYLNANFFKLKMLTFLSKYVRKLGS
jgi:hypothetical protein